MSTFQLEAFYSSNNKSNTNHIFVTTVTNSLLGTYDSIFQMFYEKAIIVGSIIPSCR